MIYGLAGLEPTILRWLDNQAMLHPLQTDSLSVCCLQLCTTRMLAAMLLAGLLCQPAWSWRGGTTACPSGATSCRGGTPACLAAQLWVCGHRRQQQLLGCLLQGKGCLGTAARLRAGVVHGS